MEGIRLSNTNYKIAVKVLMEQYGRKDLITDNYRHSLLSIKLIESPSQVSWLRHLYAQIQFRTGCLESLCMSAAECMVVQHGVLMR